MQGNSKSCTAHARLLIPSLSVTPVRFCDCFLNWRAASAAGAITFNLSWQQCVAHLPRSPTTRLTPRTFRFTPTPPPSSYCFLQHLTRLSILALPLTAHADIVLRAKTCRLLSLSLTLSLYLFICNFLPPLLPPLIPSASASSCRSSRLSCYYFCFLSFLFFPSA